ncbi:MAG: HAMP domain-containing histidine kinase [Aquiluna sp.]|nr:HAMP domain-containing histidine kinase [Aquiluna sp.]MCF8545799.1 HAMP domain-containing histidine kinase [Aquiluna sp.]
MMRLALLRSTRVRLLAWVLVPVLLVLVLTLFTAWFMLTQQQQQSIDGHLQREATELQVLANKAIDPKTDAPFETARGVLELYIQRTVTDPNETMFVIVNGQVLARTTDTPPVRLDQDPMFLEIANSMTKAGFGNFSTDVGNARFIVVPVIGESDSGALVGVIFSDRQSQEITDLLYRFALIVFLSLIAATAVGWLVAGRALRPINEITTTAHEIGAHDLTRRISKSKAGSELNKLVDEFNLMLGRIEETVASNKQFVDDAGHELRTPLTVISGHLELIESDPTQRESSMEIVKDELSRMSRLVKDLQTLTKVTQPDFIQTKPVKLSDLGDELLVKASQLGDRNWELSDIPKQSWNLDRERVTQAVLQLAENACRFTNEGDLIRVEILTSVNNVAISVSDSGPGVPKDQRETIKERFVRGSNPKSDSGGAGLGLAVVSAIAKGHGGELLISDSDLGGAKFTLQLPRSN